VNERSFNSGLDDIAAIARCETTCTAVLEACFDRIRSRERDVHAWSCVATEVAKKKAERLDKTCSQAPLRGLPIGIKDIIDTADIPTEYGSVLFPGNRPERNAAIVNLLTAAGAVVVGKTVTSEFAYKSPAPTRNPANLARSPGGSSSGSAAAVASGMVPFAIGTQTGGSVVRPAAYCGIVGFKPTYECYSLQGVQPLSPSADTIGFFARSVRDIALVQSSLCPGQSTPPTKVRALALDLSDLSQGAVTEAFWSFLDAIRGCGIVVTRASTPAAIAEVAVHTAIFHLEAGYWLRRWLGPHARLASDTIQALFAAADEVSVQHYRRGCQAAVSAVRWLEGAQAEYDVILTPAAPDEPPPFGSTQDVSIYNRSWTVLHAPVLAIPFATGPKDLPLGLQLIGACGKDLELLSIGSRIEKLVQIRRQGI
jgi:Asp-tRNA(Asn)/Glu-tRNA(Gln) amidotransferase A subunit family amidase